MSVTRLVAHGNPDGRETPLLLLGELRSIDPSVELVYFGARDWRLGCVRTGQGRDSRAKAGDRILDDVARMQPEQRNPKTIMLAHLLKQGFAQIAQYFDQGDAAGTVKDAWGNTTTIVHDFRERDSHWRRDQGQAVVAAAVREAGGASLEKEKKRVLDNYLATEGRAHYRREIRGRVQFGAGGMTGGRGRILSPNDLVPGGSRIITGDEVLADLAEIMADLGAGA